MRSIVITGIGGLIGSNLAHFVKKMYPACKIIGIDDFSGGYKENVNPNVLLYNFDLGKESADFIFENHQPDIVYHFAAYAAEALSPFIRQYNYVNNLLATAGIDE